MHNIVAKPAPQYGSKMWVLKPEVKKRAKASETRFLGNGIIMQKGRLLNVCRAKRIFIALLEDETLDVQEEHGHNSFSFGTDYDSIPDLAEEDCKAPLLQKILSPISQDNSRMVESHTAYKSGHVNTVSDLRLLTVDHADMSFFFIWWGGT
jgi:hypothetical protein